MNYTGVIQPVNLAVNRLDRRIMAVSTDLDHYRALRAAAENASHRSGVPVTVKVAEYWIGGRQQTDCYTVTWPQTCQGPMSFEAARDLLTRLTVLN